MQPENFQDYTVICLWFVWGAFLLLFVLKSSQWLRKRSEKRENPYIGRYEKLGSYWMIFIAVGLGCMMTLVLFTVFSD